MGRLGHIGIVGCSAEGAALCYRTICVEGAERLGGHPHPEVSMHTPSLQDYVDCLERDDIDGVGALMLASAEKLAGVGADFLICPDNTIHQAFDHVAERSPLPWLHIAEVVGLEARRLRAANPIVLGTEWLMKSRVYQDRLARLGVDCRIPPQDDRSEIGRIIMAELVRSEFSPASTAWLVAAIERARDAGADAVILGCTELPLVLNAENSPLPVLDSTRLLARAALERAIGDKVGQG